MTGDPRKTITPAEWERVAAVLDGALDLSRSEWPAYLQQACGGDDQLRARVERLLEAGLRTDGLLDTPPSAWLTAIIADNGESALPQTRFGPFRAIGILGHGGMGTVYLAERADGEFEQRVALKVIRPGIDSKEILRRFLSERQILARLQHPNIARLLDGGRSEDGQPWFALDLVDGEAITAYCDARQLPVPRRLELFEEVCEAVAHAHGTEVIHRDLKPSNILVTAMGRVQLLDFGIAKLLREGDPSELTLTGLRIMTPDYAAPEQVRVERVTPATDIYALGAVLYELLTGYRAHNFTRYPPTVAEIERVVCTEDPEAPSSIVTHIVATEQFRRIAKRTPEEVARARGTEPERLHQQLKGELDRIVLTALRKQPDQRYPSVAALLADVRTCRQRLQEAEPRPNALDALLRALGWRR
jgi:serine/threonine-protein kinase